MPDRHIVVRAPQYMDKNVNEAEVWKVETSTKGFQSHEIIVGMNDKRVVSVKGQRNPNRPDPKNDLYHEFRVPKSVATGTLRCYYHDKTGMIHLMGNRKPGTNKDKSKSPTRAPQVTESPSLNATTPAEKGPNQTKDKQVEKAKPQEPVEQKQEKTTSPSVPTVEVTAPAEAKNKAADSPKRTKTPRKSGRKSKSPGRKKSPVSAPKSKSPAPSKSRSKSRSGRGKSPKRK